MLNTNMYSKMLQLLWLMSKPIISSTYSNKCWYYYSNTTTTTTTNLNGGGIAGAVVGGVFGLVILIIVIVCLVRKCRAQQLPKLNSPSHDHQQTIVVNTTQHQLDPMVYNNPYGPTQTFAQPYVQPTPIYPQQIYQQPNY